MKKLTKSQLKKIANIYAGTVIYTFEPLVAFAGSNLSRSELSTLEIYFEEMSKRLRNGENPIFESNMIVDYVRETYK